jgi:hypothetical protein
MIGFFLVVAWMGILNITLLGEIPSFISSAYARFRHQSLA